MNAPILLPSSTARRVAYRHYPSPFGPLVLVADDQNRLVRIVFLNCVISEEYVRETVETFFPADRYELDYAPDAASGTARQLDEYFASERRLFDLEVAPIGTDFQRQVWLELMRIPCGQTRTYGEMAERLGRPNAARAIGRANATNPLPIVVPCHRLVGANGDLTGFAGGLDFKRKLLDLERDMVREI